MVLVEPEETKDPPGLQEIYNVMASQGARQTQKEYRPKRAD